MQNDALAKVIGTPADGVTHWGIARIVNGKTQRLDHPNADNVRVSSWPTEELSLDEVRSRWGHGTFKVIWLSPESDDPHRRSGGWSPPFTLEAEAATRVAMPTPTMPAMPMPIAASANGVSASDLLTVMTTMMQLSDKRSDAFLTAVLDMRGQTSNAQPPAENRELSELRAAVAAMTATMQADKREREITERHREELRKKDEEIARLAREKENAEREAREASEAEPPRLDPGSPLLSQIGYGIMNAAMAKPELVGKVLEVAAPYVDKLMGGNAGPAGPPAKTPPPNGVPAPRALHGEGGQPNRDANRPPVVPVVRAQPPAAPVVRAPEPEEPEVTVAPPSPVAGAPEGNSSWQPIGNAAKEPAVAEVAAG